jgi:hypothetical protein
MTSANYGQRQPNSTAYIKTFIEGNELNLDNLWKQSLFINNKIDVLTPTNANDIYIPRNIYIGGQIIHTIPKTLQEGTSNYLETSPNIISIVQELQNQVQELQKQVQELQKIHLQNNANTFS